MNCAFAQKNKVDYPQAEWSKASVILMHTPGQELFDGVIHPSAGLFEDYFDVEKAAAEHRNYIKMLQKNGIKVYTVRQILEETGIDSLRALAGELLQYDVSALDDDAAVEADRYKKEVIAKMSRADLIR
ncbi:MAG: hypothetical protein IKQ52_04075, partial [Bacteroidales bacterium]|nr:hypothetical protein [Bacteroidales bacterium]